MGALWSDQKKQTNIILKYSLILHNNEPFLDWTLTYDEKWILCSYWQWPVQWLDWEEAPKHFPNLYQIRSWSLVVFCWSDLLQLCESRQNHYIWELCSANWWKAPKTNTSSKHWSTERTQFFSTRTDCMLLYNQCFRSWLNWATKFCLIHHIHLTSRQPTATSSSISTTFCRKKASTTSRRQKMLSLSSLNPKAWIFMLQK